MSISYEWRGAFASAEVEALHAAAFDHAATAEADWHAQVDRYSLGWVCARQDQELVGFVNVAWDGRTTPSSLTPPSLLVTNVTASAPS